MAAEDVVVTLEGRTLFAGVADYRCGTFDGEHPWMLRITLPTAEAGAFEAVTDQLLAVQLAGARIGAARVVAGRFHLPGPSVVDLFGDGPCPRHPDVQT